jgi:hypothetical protein
MPANDPQKAILLKRTWTDRLVTVCDRPELARFQGRIGRVVTVNSTGQALVDFADGAWYDIPATDDHLTRLADDDERKTRYDPKANSAQIHPERQS